MADKGTSSANPRTTNCEGRKSMERRNSLQFKGENSHRIVAILSQNPIDRPQLLINALTGKVIWLLPIKGASTLNYS